MKHKLKFAFLLMTLLVGVVTVAQAVDPYIGYVYPAGGQKGTSFDVTVGGQRLGRVDRASVTGGGVKLTFVEHREPELRIFRKLKNERDKVLSEIEAKKARGESVDGITIPDVPKHKRDPRSQPNAQIEETVFLKVVIAPDAEPGVREIRLHDGKGASNPLIFQVGAISEINEDTTPGNKLKAIPPTVVGEMPALLNGRVLPGEADRFSFHAKKGQHLVFVTYARALIPYLADAVPGWFQAVLSLHDADGKELALVDDYQFNPDPVLFFDPPADGEYELRIKDSIDRGREDFVYRIAIGELPFVKGIFPLGGKLGEKVVANLSGVNLKSKTVELDTSALGMKSTAVDKYGPFAQMISSGVDQWSELFEEETTEGREKIQLVATPCVVNGVISKVGEVDTFSFNGRKGDEFVAEVYARRLNSPLDSMLALTDSSGKVIQANDDNVDRSFGLVTHHADSYIRCVFPEDGIYRISIRDVQQKGSEAHSYRLRLGPAQPDFNLRVTPSNISVPLGGSASITVHVLRKDGFDGEVEIGLKGKDGPLSLKGIVPSGSDSARLTLACSKEGVKGLATVQVKGTADIKGQQVVRQAMPADDRMQAFLWRFLVPAEEWAVTVRYADKVSLKPQLADGKQILIPAGDSVDLIMKIDVNGKVPKGDATMMLALDSPPDGISMQTISVTAKDKTVKLTFAADEEIVKIGDQGYLVVTGLSEKRNDVIGMAPAIPFKIVE